MAGLVHRHRVVAKRRTATSRVAAPHQEGPSHGGQRTWPLPAGRGSLGLMAALATKQVPTPNISSASALRANRGRATSRTGGPSRPGSRPGRAGDRDRSAAGVRRRDPWPLPSRVNASGPFDPIKVKAEAGGSPEFRAREGSRRLGGHARRTVKAGVHQRKAQKSDLAFWTLSPNAASADRVLRTFGAAAERDGPDYAARGWRGSPAARDS
jgi:hypothetical protein